MFDCHKNVIQLSLKVTGLLKECLSLWCKIWKRTDWWLVFYQWHIAFMWHN